MFNKVDYADLKINDFVRIYDEEGFVVEGKIYLFHSGSKGFSINTDKGNYVFVEDQWENYTVRKQFKTHHHDHRITVETTNTPIKSDGGSSSYYDIDIPSWLLDVINTRQKEGRCFIKTEELIETLGSDFDEGNILKCLVRINSLKKGKGKAGNSITYDSNKIIYSANRLKERESRNDK